MEQIKDLRLVGVRDRKLNELYESICNEISDSVSSINDSIGNLESSLEWDKLVVSFFGETNAGKSTIIEALIDGNGDRIGEGQKDFTQAIEALSFQRVIILDMPGIEGREEIVVDSILKAVDRSHVIFYIIGTNKEVEESTVKKMQHLLRHNAKVYSVLNLRGRPSVYLYNKVLINDNSKKVESRIKRKFEEFLGGNYAGNIIINGYLALMKSPKLVGTRFEKDKLKALDIFGDVCKIEEFSNLSVLSKTIENLSQTIKYEILVSNTYKFLGATGDILGALLRDKKEFDATIKIISGLTNNYLLDIESIFSKYSSEIEMAVEICMDRLKVDLSREFNRIIDDGKICDEHGLRAELDKVRILNEQSLKNAIQKLLNSMKSEIEIKISEFKGRIDVLFSGLRFKGSINFEKIFASLKFGFGYVLSQIADLGVSIYGVILAFAVHPLLGIVSGVVLVLKTIWNWFFVHPDERKNKTKTESLVRIDEYVTEARHKVLKDLKKELGSIRLKTKEPAFQLSESMKGVRRISFSLDKIVLDLKRAQLDMSVMLSKEILGNEVLFSYCDLNISQMVVVCFYVNAGVHSYLESLFRVDKLKIYSSLGDLLRNIGYFDTSSCFVVSNEFDCRVANALLLHESCPSMLTKVRRG